MVDSQYYADNRLHLQRRADDGCQLLYSFGETPRRLFLDEIDKLPPGASKKLVITGGLRKGHYISPSFPFSDGKAYLQSPRN